MPRSFRLRDIACQYPGCNKLFANQAGLKIHIRTKHRRQERLLRQQQLAANYRCQANPNPNESDEDSDWPSPEVWRSHLPDESSSRRASPEPGPSNRTPEARPNDPRKEHGEEVRFHPTINGWFINLVLHLFTSNTRSSL